MENNNYAKILDYWKKLPPLYESTERPFWDDAHISRGMLAAHLSPDTDAASRKPAFIASSADWLKSVIGGGRLLDLGCGPGLYAEEMNARGFEIVGVDFSQRSIAYAKEHAKSSGLDIDYRCMNYLDIDFENEFDAAILVYCDFGVLSPDDRARLLNKVRRALRPGGHLLLDAWNTPYGEAFKEGDSIEYRTGGFWSPAPHLLLTQSVYFRETNNTLERYMVVTDDDIACYNIWNQVYCAETLCAELALAGFTDVEFFDDIAGAPYTGGAETLCAHARI